jgi:hypothetical protein
MNQTKRLKFEDAIELVVVLPGKVLPGKGTRVKFANVIKRYMAGDEGMVKVLSANAQSTRAMLSWLEIRLWWTRISSWRRRKKHSFN